MPADRTRPSNDQSIIDGNVPPAGGGRGRWHPVAITALFVGTTLALNLGVWAVGVIAGGTFVHLIDGHPHTTTAPQGVMSMTTGTMVLGLSLAALVGPRWPWAFRVGQVIGAAAPLASIINTVTAGFDQPSTIALTAMHVAIAIATPSAIETLRRRSRTSTF